MYQKSCIEKKCFALILTACNSETTQWKNVIQGSYCRASQELQNGCVIMGIGPREPKFPTFCARHL